MRHPKYASMNRKNKKLSKSRNWTDDECIVLVALYSISEFRIGDDNSKENKVLAKSFNRNKAAVDRQWRNIKDYMERMPDKNISSVLKYWSDVSIQNIDSLLNLSETKCIDNNWLDIAEMINERRKL